MANSVVGNYDVVVQVSLAAVDRFLAVMHECERFLHSTSGYLNDVAPPPVHLPPHRYAAHRVHRCRGRLWQCHRQSAADSAEVVYGHGCGEQCPRCLTSAHRESRPGFVRRR